MTLSTVHLLDYGAGNVQSVIHALESLNVHVRRIETAEELAEAQARPIQSPSLRL